jgi:hypothetical protein
MHYERLDARTRTLMLDEVERDVRNRCLRMSERLSPDGTVGYLRALRDAISTGTDQTLAAALVRDGLLKWREVHHAQNGRPFSRAMPRDAHVALAEAEFNRFYIRALCVHAASNGIEQLQIYRAKVVDVPRLRSARIGSLVGVAGVLRDLRANLGVEAALGVALGPNAGLSVRLVRPRRLPGGVKARKRVRARSVRRARSC